jgi:cysteine-S-conjugate beta-lyase
MSKTKRGPATAVIHAGRRAGRTVGPVIEKGSTVILPDAASLYDDDLVTYGRQGLVTQGALEEALAELEGAHRVRLYPSGIGALAGALLAVLKAGEEILVVDSVYAPTRRFCDRTLTRLGVKARYYDPLLSAEAVLALAGEATRLILLESPGSLSFEMQDAPGIARLARARGILTLMDNTWAAGFWFKPLAHGIDLSVQSLTKYVGGHSDVFMGSAAAAEPAVAAALERGYWDVGWGVSPEDAYQILRGLRTLPTRLARHQASALEVARWLAGRREVREVLYPALPGAAGHELWSRDYTGAPGLFSVVLQPAPEAAMAALLDALKIFRLGYSWGGFESLALNCDPQFHRRQFPPKHAGPSVRLSIGLEDPADLIADLERGLAAFGA